MKGGKRGSGGGDGEGGGGDDVRNKFLMLLAGFGRHLGGLGVPPDKGDTF